MDVRNRVGAVARADRPDRVAFGDDSILRHRDRPKVRERDGIAVGGRDRDRLAGARHRAGERDRPGGGSGNDGAEVSGDIDAAMLPTCIRVRGIEVELLQNVAARGPGPGLGRRRGEKRGQDRDEEYTTHRHHLVVRRENARTR
ncbi:MAG TPA: hypothetical protein VFB25_03330 [Gaiellaceae bacterium]|nr:hypothetical protein [Gaiellaceae bacterium]